MARSSIYALERADVHETGIRLAPAFTPSVISALRAKAVVRAAQLASADSLLP